MAKKNSTAQSQHDCLNAASCEIEKARALLDVLYESVADPEEGRRFLQQLNPGSLLCTYSVLNDLLIAADDRVQAAFRAPPEKHTHA